MNHIHEKKNYFWEDLADEDLLEIRIKDLGLHIQETGLEERINHLYRELSSKGIIFHPVCYLADEWLCPDKMPVIGIPFYLSHPKLIHLERKMMLEVEGGTEKWCMMLLRHEAGHALNYAYRLYRKSRWRELFGAFSARYSMTYSTFPYSKRFVNHLEDNYAQAHPDEDFAETFAVWLSGAHNFEQKYKGWPVMKKLHYVDSLMKTIAGKQPLVLSEETPWAANRMRSTLKAYYERKRKSLGTDFPGFYDPGLLRIFSGKHAEKMQHASRFIHKRRKMIIKSVAMWTDQRKIDIDKFIRKLIFRSESLDLYVHKSEMETSSEIISFITAVMCNTMRFNKMSSIHEKA